MVRTLSFYFLSFCLLLSALNANSSKLGEFCKRLFLPHASGSIFIKFTRERLGEKFSVDSKWDKWEWDKWERQIRTSLKGWTTEEAKEFLHYLEARIGEKATIKSIQYYPSYFQRSGYKKFRETVSFYESFIGKEAVTKHLKKSLKGFFYEDSLQNLKQVVEFVEYYIGEDTAQKNSLQDLMIQNLGDFSPD